MAAPLLRRLLPAALLAMWTAPVLAQGAAPQLSRAERETLRTVVAAVDAASELAPQPESDWPVHLLRASDGSHYLAFTALVPPELSTPGPATLYVRLASRPGATARVERSAVMEWLQGLRQDPLPQRPARVVSVPTGELPVSVGGAQSPAGTVSRPNVDAGQHSAALRLLELERERARERREEAERARRATLASDTAADRSVYPFEDFDARAGFEPVSGGRIAIRRAITAGPGDFDLYVGWQAAGAAPETPVHVLRRQLRLPPATSGDLGVSSIILADDVRTLDQAWAAEAQSAHPYAIGAMEIVPKLDAVFTAEDQLTVIFQVINARATAAGKPDVTVGFRIVEPSPAGETLVATLNPQNYHAEVLPPDFDLNRGHPLIVAMTAPLDSLRRGDYRLLVGLTDRIAGRSTTARLDFRVTPTPRTLLREAPAVTIPRFDRQQFLRPDRRDAILAALRPEAPSDALTRVFDTAADGRFIDLLREEPVEPDEVPTRTALRGLTNLALGATPATVAIQLQQALRDGSAAGPTHALLGAARALEGQDRAAAASWEAAAEAGFDRPELAREALYAYLRTGDHRRAWTLAEAAATRHADDQDLRRWHAVAALQAGEESDALATIDGLDPESAAVPDVRFLALQALYSGFVHGRGVGHTPEGRTRFTTLARDYIDAGHPHAALVRDWLAIVTSR